MTINKYVPRTETYRVNSYYHILINEESRKKGYATYVLQELEEDMKSLGITSMGLNVFGTNPNARKLYEKLGYKTASTAMGKRI